jgi:hypothetical protein
MPSQQNIAIYSFIDFIYNFITITFFKSIKVNLDEI